MADIPGTRLDIYHSGPDNTYAVRVLNPTRVLCWHESEDSARRCAIDRVARKDGGK